jgi:hypothetical protein
MRLPEFDAAADQAVEPPWIHSGEDAQLDDGVFWPTAYAVLEVTAEVENALRALVRTASS